MATKPVAGSGTMLTLSTINVASPPAAGADLISSVSVESVAVKSMSVWYHGASPPTGGTPPGAGKMSAELATTTPSSSTMAIGTSPQQFRELKPVEG